MVVGVLVFQVLTVITTCVLLLQLMRQQGGILIRLDELERAASQPVGFGVGSLIPDIELPDADAGKTQLSSFRGRRVLLVYWNPECEFCDMAASDLAALQPALKQNDTELILLAYADAESNRRSVAEHGLTCAVLLLESSPAQQFIMNELFKYSGTPSAYLLDKSGCVSKPMAVGIDQVLLLAREAASSTRALKNLPLANSHIEREGLKLGVAAPDFTLPDLNGCDISLGHFRGRKVLLVFSDPQCGPCDELTPHLVRLHQQHRQNGLAIVMVGRGGREENQKKAIQHGIDFPVVLQDRWKLSRQFGIFATPVGFLIDQHGIITRSVAKGPDQIMTLAREALALH
jgi:peroxiredoxin